MSVKQVMYTTAHVCLTLACHSHLIIHTAFRSLAMTKIKGKKELPKQVSARKSLNQHR